MEKVAIMEKVTKTISRKEHVHDYFKLFKYSTHPCGGVREKEKKAKYP